MQDLKDEIERKRKSYQEIKEKSKSKYLKRSDFIVENHKEAETAVKSVNVPELAQEAVIEEQPTTIQIEESLLRQRFRAKQQPVLLFGETYEQRIQRLEKVELEEQNHQSYAEKLQLAGKNMTEEILKGESGQDIDRETALMNQIMAIDTSGISIDLYKHDPDHCRYLIIIYFKKLLYEWDRMLHKKSNEEKQQQQWIIQSANQSQTAESMRPLFKQLKKGTLCLKQENWKMMSLKEYVKCVTLHNCEII